MTKTQFISEIRAVGERSYSLPHFIDALLAAEIKTVPRLRKNGYGLLSLRFERDGISVTRGDVGVATMGQFYYSVSNHDPILRKIESDLKAGLAQPVILNAANEVQLDIPRAAAPGYAQAWQARQLTNILDDLEQDTFSDQAMMCLNWGFDDWSSLDSDALRKEIGEHIDPDIETLQEPHRAAAMRWVLRFKEVTQAGVVNMGDISLQGFAVFRQEAIQRLADPILAMQNKPALDATPEP